jgi:hypothetical protein
VVDSIHDIDAPMASAPVVGEPMSLREVAAELAVSPTTVARWCTRGIRGHKLPCLALGKRKFVARRSLIGWIRLINEGNELPASDSAHAQNGAAT